MQLTVINITWMAIERENATIHIVLDGISVVLTLRILSVQKQVTIHFF